MQLDVGNEPTLSEQMSSAYTTNKYASVTENYYPVWFLVKSRQTDRQTTDRKQKATHMGLSCKMHRWAQMITPAVKFSPQDAVDARTSYNWEWLFWQTRAEGDHSLHLVLHMVNNSAYYTMKLWNSSDVLQQSYIFTLIKLFRSLFSHAFHVIMGSWRTYHWP